MEVNGFLCPGHVSVLTGWEVFRFLAEDHHIPGAVVEYCIVVQNTLAMEMSFTVSKEIGCFDWH